LAKVQGGAITRIKVMEDGVYVEKTDQADVEHHTMEMCSARFRLTENTPLRQEPMHSALGPFAINTAAAREILQGNYVVPAEVDDYTGSSYKQSKQVLLSTHNNGFLVQLLRKTFNGIGKNQKSERHPPFLAYTMDITRRRQQMTH
jgi:hypothetical protein